MQRSGVTLQQPLEHYFSSDTGTLSKSPSCSKTILIEIGPRKRPVGRPRKVPPAVMASVMAATPKLVDYSSTDSESLQRIAPMYSKQPGNMHVIPITMRHSNIAPKWCDNFLTRSENASVTILNYFFWHVN